MLRKHPEVAEKITDAFIKHFRRLVKQYIGPFSQAPRMPIHEGRGGSLDRRDGSRAEIEPKKMTSTILEVNESELADLHPLKLLATFLDRMDAGARDHAHKLLEHFFEEIRESTEKSGNIVDVDGEELSPDHILEALETMRVDFDRRTGRPKAPSLHAHPQQAEKVEKIWSDIIEDPELAERANKILDEHRRNWRAREADRKLVRQCE